MREVADLGVFGQIRPMKCFFFFFFLFFGGDFPVI